MLKLCLSRDFVNIVMSQFPSATLTLSNNAIDTAETANSNQGTLQLELNGHAQPEADDDNHADDGDDDDARVSMTNIIVGSADFLSRIMLSVTDDAFCFMMQGVPFRHLRGQQIKSLSLGKKMRKVAKDEWFCALHDKTARSVVQKQSRS
jgi:hypothetical protein